MRILHVAPICGYGGVETVLLTLIRQQLSEGLDAEVFYFSDLGGSANYANHCKVWTGDRISLTDLLLSRDYDIVHAVTVSAHSAMTCLRRSLHRGAVVFTCHGFEGYDGTLGADCITAVSRSAGESIRSLCRVPLHVVYNGVDTSQFFYRPEATAGKKPVVAWVGRSADPDKDAALLLASSESLAERGFQLAVLDGSAVDTNLSNDLPGDAEVISRKPWLEMGDFYRSVAASGGFLLSTSNIEACPMNLLEAQACGCPVIAPEVGGIPEVIAHKLSGYVYSKPLGVKGILQGMDWLYECSNYATAIGAGVELIRERHSAAIMCREYAAIYDSVLTNHRGRHSSRLLKPIVRTCYGALRRGKKALGREVMTG